MNYKQFIFTLFLLCSTLTSWAISASVANAIYLDQSQHKSYIEIYTHIVGQSVVFTQVADNNYQSNIQSTILIKDGEKIINYKKYNLASPLTSSKIDFSDVVRLYLPDGNYTIEVELLDLNKQENTFTSTEKIQVGAQLISSLRLLSSVKKSSIDDINSKNGVSMEALAYNRYFDRQKILYGYFELYPELKAEYSYLRYAIEQDGKTVYEKLKRYKNEVVIPCLVNFDISELGSNEYEFVVELLEKDKSIIVKKSLAFTRSNTQLDMLNDMKENNTFQNSFVMDYNKSSLDYNIKATMPIVSSLERQILSNALSNDKVDIKRYALYEYWRRRTNGEHTREHFNAYMKVAKAIDEKYYSGFGYGFETDRGYLFLKYGKPTNTINIINEPSAPPYEIWVYAFLEETHENNVKFVFYSPSLSDDYVLLHSTCKNELSNKLWERELYKNAQNDMEGNSIDGGKVKSNWNRKARFYFDSL